MTGPAEPTIQETPAADVVVTEPVVDETTSNNPPYIKYLEEFDPNTRQLVEPVFKKWDSDTGKKFQEVHSEYEPLKAYKEFADKGLTPDELNQAWGLLNAINEDPRKVWEAMNEQFKFAEQGQQGTPEDEEDPDAEFDPFKDPRFKAMADQVQNLTQLTVAQRQEQEQLEFNKTLDAELAALKEKHGDYDTEYVLTQMAAGKTGEQAVQIWNEKLTKFMESKKAPAAPVMLGSGGGVPSSPIDVSKMTPKETREHVAQMLAQAAKENT